MDQQPFLNVFVGHAGSGKSYFARQLAEAKRWTRLNGDSMRASLFGSHEASYKYPLELRQTGVFHAIDYAAEQILRSGQSVIYDANSNKRSIRLDKEKMARRCNAIPIVVWVQTPKDIAMRRSQDREATVDQQRFTEEKAREVVERHIANTDEPNEDENVIIIDGTLPFTEQLAAYETQLQKFTKELRN